MRPRAVVQFLFVAGLLQAAAGVMVSPSFAAAPEPVVVSALPKLKNGVPAYPVPFMAIGRTPHVIAPLSGKAINIQTDFGFPGGFSGFVNAAIGSVGYPGNRNFTNLDVAYDSKKLCLLVCVPYPYGRKTRALATAPTAELFADDVFEVLLDPRDEQGRSKGPVYRIVGNAAGVYKIDRDMPQIGQPHQSWQAGVKYGSMMWDPMGSWMAAVQIPFDDLGGTARWSNLGRSSRDSLRRSENHGRAFAGGRFHRSLALRPASIRRRAPGKLSLPLALRRRDPRRQFLRRRHFQQRRQ